MRKYLAVGFLFLLLVTLVATQNVAVAQSSKVPVVILFVPTATENQKTLAVSSIGGEITRRYTIINGVAALVPPESVPGLQSNPLIVSVDRDVEFHALDLNADQQIRADLVWGAGDTGQVVPVAILDTGIYTGHGEFTGRILKCHNEIFLTPDSCDDGNGHGTHVAGIAGAAGVYLQAKGVAPAISFYIDQVLNSAGSGSLSGIIAGIDWARANGAKVVSMSLGTSPLATTQPNCDSSYPTLTSAVNNAVAAGVTVVAAAGNSGTSGVGAPGCISSTIAVGAVDSSDTIASFSSQGGPLADHGIVAPGVNILSTWLGGGYNTISGTSMATPHVSGTVALLLKVNPSLSPSQVRSILFSTACTQSTTPSCPTGPVANTIYGYGRVDAYRAYGSVGSPSPDFSLSASPSSLTIQQGGSGSSTITVSSLNGFSSAVTLSLSGNPSGVAGTFSFNPVTPPSGGSATSTLTLTVSTSTAAGTYALTVGGNSGSLSHSTTISLTVSSAPSGSLSVVISFDKSPPTYTRNSWVYITVTVSANGLPVSGASVVITITDPKGGAAIGSGTTGTNGKVVFKYRVGPKATLGTYAVSVIASALPFGSGAATATFNVQ